MKIFVIAYSLFEAQHWIKHNYQRRTIDGITPASPSDYVYVDSPVRLRGIQDPHGVFVGRWKERLDISEIVETLFMCSIHVNPQLEKIRNDIKPKIRPTPKIKPMQVYVDEAAELLAKEIDTEVLRQLRLGTP